MGRYSEPSAAAFVVLPSLRDGVRLLDLGKDRNARWAVIKNPGELTDEQQLSLARIKRTNTALYRAYLLKEQLRAVFAVKGQRGKLLL